jgi:hypothetical protein
MVILLTRFVKCLVRNKAIYAQPLEKGRCLYDEVVVVLLRSGRTIGTRQTVALLVVRGRFAAESPGSGLSQITEELVKIGSSK